MGIFKVIMLEEQGSCAQSLWPAGQAAWPQSRKVRSTRVTHLPQGIPQVTADDFVIAKLPFIHELTNLIAERKGNFPRQEKHSAEPGQERGSIWKCLTLGFSAYRLGGSSVLECHLYQPQANLNPSGLPSKLPHLGNYHTEQRKGVTKGRGKGQRITTLYEIGSHRFCCQRGSLFPQHSALR